MSPLVVPELPVPLTDQFTADIVAAVAEPSLGVTVAVAEKVTVSPCLMVPEAGERVIVIAPDAPSVVAAFAGTMTRLKIIVNASSDERNFFIIFFILSCCFDLGSARTEPFSYIGILPCRGE